MCHDLAQIKIYICFSPTHPFFSLISSCAKLLQTVVPLLAVVPLLWLSSDNIYRLWESYVYLASFRSFSISVLLSLVFTTAALPSQEASKLKQIVSVHSHLLWMSFYTCTTLSICGSQYFWQSSFVTSFLRYLYDL